MRGEVLAGTHAGRYVGRYRLITEVARGGMASVYLAVDTSSADARLSAVKIVHDQLTDDAALVRMFFDEARLARRITHANTARVLDFGSEGRLHYLVMDYLLGETWQEVLSQAAKAASTGARLKRPLLLAHVLQRAALGLHAAHEARDSEDNPLEVVHRDVSPQNIMVGYDGQVHVLDFGIAKVSNRIHDTEHGTVKGRFAYMAPEQMHGRHVDRRADLWSLGVVLWEGLTCRRLFRRDSDPETIMAATYDPIPSPKMLNPEAPDALCDITEQLLERDRERRPSTAQHVAEKLEAYLQSEGVSLSQQTVRAYMVRLFGPRVDEKRRTVERLRRRFSRPIAIDVLLPREEMPTLPAPDKLPRRSGVRERGDADDAVTLPPKRPSFSEYPTSPRLTVPRLPNEATAQPRASSLSAFWIVSVGALLGAAAYFWLSG